MAKKANLIAKHNCKVSYYRLVQAFIRYVIPDIPNWVEVMIERQKYVCKQKMLRHDMGDAKYEEIFHEKAHESWPFMFYDFSFEF